MFYLRGDRGDDEGWMLALPNRWNIRAVGHSLITLSSCCSHFGPAPGLKVHHLFSLLAKSAPPYVPYTCSLVSGSW
jgi:hypothetical protein